MIFIVLFYRLSKLRHPHHRNDHQVHRLVYEFDYIAQLNRLQSYYSIHDLLSDSNRSVSGTLSSLKDSSRSEESSTDDEIPEKKNLKDYTKEFKESPKKNITQLDCRMGNCFDFQRCKLYGQNAKIYVYPIDDERVSETFLKIVNIVKSSKYYEPDPEKGKFCASFHSFFH